MIWYGILLSAALAMNMRDWRMLTLSAVVGAGIFMPIPDAYFYLICSIVEAGVALVAILLNARASRPVVRVSLLLAIFHGLGWWFNGYPPESPYHYMVPICEYTELVMCILLSRPFPQRSENGL
jgi:hypothetical protein